MSLGKPFHIDKDISGAILVEDFQKNEIDHDLWREWIQDRALTLKQEDGTFRVAGTSGDPTNPEYIGFRFTGLVSVRRRSCDAVLVARMRVPNGLSDVPGMKQNMVHLCGSNPDYFLEVVYAEDTRGRRGWFQYRLAHDGFFFEEPPMLESETAEEFRDIKIEYRHSEKKAQGFLRTADGWTPVGPPQDLFMSTMKVELKVNCPTDGVPIRAEFRDCRLYPLPSTAPVEFLVTRWPPPLYLCPGQRVRLTDLGSGRVLGEAVTDRWAKCAIALPDDLTYPISCRLEIFRDDAPIVETTIEAEGVKGLYPGDQWAVVLDAET